MTTAGRASLVGAIVCLLIVGLALQPDERTYSPTSFGKTNMGYGAVYDLLDELGVPTTRSLQSPSSLAEDATVWWLEPYSACARGEEDESPPFARDLSFEEWLRAGRTAVVFAQPAYTRCSALWDVPIPWVEDGDPWRLYRPGAASGWYSRSAVDAEPNEILPADTNDAAVEADANEPLLTEADFSNLLHPLAGLGSKTLYLHLHDFAAFEHLPLVPPGDVAWTVTARLHGWPYVTEREVGEGKLVVVAYGSPLRNSELDFADNSVYAVRLVERYGAPVFDEYSHGLRAEHGTLRYLATSPALAVFACLAVLALAAIAFGRTVPPRTLTETDIEPPNMEAYVDSLAGLLARTKSYGQLLDRYRAATAARVRRGLRLGPDAPLEAVELRLRRIPHLSASGLDFLFGDTTATSAEELRAAVKQLDSLVVEVIG